MNRTAILLACALAMCAALGACSARSPEARFARSVQEIRSWTAASRMVVDGWQRRALPASYAMDAFHGAWEEVTQQMNEVEDMREIPGASRREVADTARELAALCARLNGDVEYGDRPAVAGAAAQLRQIDERLQRITRDTAGR